MIRLGKRRPAPRQRLIGEGTINWIKDSASGVGLILFMVAAWTGSQHLHGVLAWAHEFRLTFGVGDHVVTLWR